MLYYLFEYLDKTLNISGTGVFQYITFRSALVYTILVVVYDLWKRIILCKISKWEKRRELGLAGQNEKGYANHGRLNYIYSGACCVVCKVAKYLRSAFDQPLCGWEQ
jgi:phospho-N-acetylmuramoyl-pentapeptide-transferase